MDMSSVLVAAIPTHPHRWQFLCPVQFVGGAAHIVTISKGEGGRREGRGTRCCSLRPSGSSVELCDCIDERVLGPARTGGRRRSPLTTAVPCSGTPQTPTGARHSVRDGARAPHVRAGVQQGSPRITATDGTRAARRRGHGRAAWAHVCDGGDSHGGAGGGMMTDRAGAPSASRRGSGIPAQRAGWFAALPSHPRTADR